MKVLITSGGTKVKIDMVRSITNMSKGTFGAKIAESFLLSGETDLEVIFLQAKGSKYPFEQDDDYYVKYIVESNQITFVTYETYDDYARLLDEQLKLQPDIIVLAAAVSDYGVANYVDGKIRSKDNMTIELKPLPKLISTVREKCPDAVICGFKLLVNSTDEELVIEAKKSLILNQLDLVVGNDLRDIKANNHRLLIADIELFQSFARHTIYTKQHFNLPDVVVSKCFEKYKERKMLQRG